MTETSDDTLIQNLQAAISLFNTALENTLSAGISVTIREEVREQFGKGAHRFFVLSEANRVTRIF